jgi:hypothetical protein
LVSHSIASFPFALVEARFSAFSLRPPQRLRSPEGGGLLRRLEPPHNRSLNESGAHSGAPLFG